ncbi:1,6-anhydro-N-acetylmuramyl-L-alanine amidase AmpD [Variovorax sp. Varisp62]|uniref:1,6-anhydro-N-acetylmuramyl-L-alanine amidase AmpD n=1 Tax=Variovorax sp. Varisp62 TaxID=3243049 RepID=UPI0039B63D29
MPTTEAPTPGAPNNGDDGLWQAGWYRFAKALRSPNFGPRPTDAQTDLIVLHSISLPPGEYGGDAVQRLFTNQLDWDAHPYFQSIRGLEVSSHFYVRRNGELWQFVSCDDRAWHAGASSWRGRGNCNDDSVGIELEGLEGQPFDEPQYETLASLCAAVAQHYPIAHIAGHEHIAPGRKQDPGAGFEWRRLREQLGWNPQMFPPQVTQR